MFSIRLIIYECTSSGCYCQSNLCKTFYSVFMLPLLESSRITLYLIDINSGQGTKTDTFFATLFDEILGYCKLSSSMPISTANPLHSIWRFTMDLQSIFSGQGFFHMWIGTLLPCLQLKMRVKLEIIYFFLSGNMSLFYD